MKAPPLLLPPDTRLTCPHCEKEFSLEEGFAKQALESAEAASTEALGELRQLERAAAERRAEQLATERDTLERDTLRKQLAERQTQIQQLRNEQLAMREERQKLKDEKEALA